MCHQCAKSIERPEQDRIPKIEGVGRGQYSFGEMEFGIGLLERFLGIFLDFFRTVNLPCKTIYFMHYNFVRIHQTLKVTPAMAAGVTSKLWEMSDVVKVLEDWEARK